MTILEMSVQAALLIAAVTILRAIAMNRLPKIAFSALWAVALCRLLMPFELTSTFSVYNVLQVPGNAAQPVGQMILAPLTGNGAQAGAAASVGMSAVPIVMVVWLAGMAAAMVFLVACYVKSCREYSASLPVQNAYVTEWMAGNKLRRRVLVRVSDRITAPLTYGVIRPRILLPKKIDWGNEQWLGYILAHEMTHIRRFDALTKLVLAGALCLHWFNPLVWVMYILANRDMEIGCDAAVVHKYGLQSAPAYALTLLNMQNRRAGFSPLASGFSKRAVTERIYAIMKHKKATIAAVIAAAVIITGITFVFATSPTQAEGAGVETPFDGNRASADVYAPYAQYGLSIEGGKLYYEGEPVRRFNDKYPQTNYSVGAVGYYEETGTVDVFTVREDTRKQELMGLEAVHSSDEDYEVIVNGGADGPTAVRTESEALDQETSEKMFAAYEEFGLTQDENGTLYYNGERVRFFSDKLKQEVLGFGSYQVTNFDMDGTVDIVAERDYAVKDEEGIGKLTGIRLATTEEISIANQEIGKYNAEEAELAE